MVYDQFTIEGKNKSIWLATTPETSFPSLIPEINVDVAILGGGIAGLMTAYFLKKAGKRVAVIEARRIAHGTTGHTTAHISIAHELIYDKLINNFGTETALNYAKANQEGIKLIEQISRAENIDCDFKIINEYIFNPLGKDEEEIRKEFEATKKIGLQTSFLNQAPLPFKTGGAIKYEGQARFHPRKFLLSLANKIIGDGSYVFEQTRALNVKEDEPMMIKTDKGNLKANDVVVATLYPFLDRGLYFSRLDVYTSYVLAVKVKDDFPDEMFDSTEERSHYLRRQSYRDSFVVLVGGEGHRTGEISDTNKRYQKLEEYARKNLDVESIKYYWSTHDTYPADEVPYIGKFLSTSKHLYVLTGFKGWGMAHGAIGGKIISDLINKKENQFIELFDPGRFKPKASAKNIINLGFKVGKMFLKSKFNKKPELNTKDLKPDEWKIYESDREKIAVYKGKDGKVHAVSAFCRHMGCTVGFNKAEKTWDCPCHGSRYTLDGEVLYGPTVKGLPKLDEKED